MVPPPWVVGGRPRRSGAARRAQTVRAHARAAQRLIQGFAALHHHRGCQPTELGAALAVVLIRQTCAPPSTPTPAPPPRADAAPLVGAADQPEARCAGSAAGAPELGAATPPAPAPRRAAYAPTTPSTPEPPPRADAAPPEARATDAPPPCAAAALPRADAPTPTSTPPRADSDASRSASPEEGDASADSLKAEGNSHFKAARYAEAITAYTLSLELDPSQHHCFSNRSVAHLKLNAARSARRDAVQCVRLAPTWPKGYARLAAASLVLKKWDDVEFACGACAEVAGDNLDDDLANVLVRMLEEAKRGRGPLDPPPGAVPPQEGR